VKRNDFLIPADIDEAFRSSLFSGSYNLLLGSGVTLDSRNGAGTTLISAEELRKALCKMTGAPLDTSLSRVYALLSPHARQDLVKFFSGCTPGPSLNALPLYLWRRLFTFNVDDILEKLYGQSGAMQSLVSLNFNAPFEPTPERPELQAIHLHGWVRDPASGFVFAAQEYVRNMQSLNPWMHLLSEILATEPFIISGTSLNEIDLEYYLSHRTESTPRRGRGPSLLVTPSADVVTRADCKRYGLTLIEATFGEFLAWISKEYPSPPSIAELVIPSSKTLFPEISEAEQLKFFLDFELVGSSDLPLPETPSPFQYGRAPDWMDIFQHLDIEVGTSAALHEFLRRPTRSPSLLVFDDAGTGKTTLLRRLGHDLARAGTSVLSVRAISRIDTATAIACLSASATPLVVLADGVADHAFQLAEIMQDTEVRSRVTLVGADRTYRQEYVDLMFSGLATDQLAPSGLTTNEYEQIIERYRRYGLIAAPFAIKDSKAFAKRLIADPVAVGVCRILNDFRPLDTIATSLWDASEEHDRLPYLCAALSHHCHWLGVRYSLLQSIWGFLFPLDRVLGQKVPLGLEINVQDDEFLVPQSPVLGERILTTLAQKSDPIVFEAFRRLAMEIAPFVNRRSIMRRSPEARLARRLFDADKVTRPLLGNRAEEFYVAVQTRWEWNSRYWEQRALLVANDDLEVGLRYARHAVAIERHPYPLNTLGRLLIRQMETGGVSRDLVFSEAFDYLSEAIDIEARRSRVSIHPYTTLFGGAIKYLESGGALTATQESRLRAQRTDARYRFAHDPSLKDLIDRLAALKP
jgi:hypothetical protein